MSENQNYLLKNRGDSYIHYIYKNPDDIPEKYYSQIRQKKMK